MEPKDKEIKMDRQMVYNAMKTPDGTVIVSQHRHDYQSYTDANGKEYMIDGGLSYIRASAHGDEELLTIYADDDFEDVRQVFCRGSRGPNGDQPLTWIPLCEMSDAHLEATIKYCKELPSSQNNRAFFDLYIQEQNYRSVNDIKVGE
jgi:hypothetical protein